MPFISVSQWLADHLRATFFIPPSAGEDVGSRVFVAVTGAEAQEISSRPQTMERIWAGPFGEHRFEVRQTPGRLDLFMLVPPGQEVLGYPILGLFQAVRDLFLASVSKWLRSPEVEILRIAFGANILHKVADRESGYDVMAQYLPLSGLDARRMQDFNMQVNIQRDLHSNPSIKINRVIRYSVIQRRGYYITNPAQALEEFNVRLDFDVSNGQESTGFLNANSLVDLLKEMSTVVDEVANGGFK